MSYVPKRVLLLTKDVKFAVNAKKALERHGSFDVVTFTQGNAAVDHARGAALDAAIIDFRLTDMPGTDVIDHLRAIQPNIAIVAAPNHSAVMRLKDKHNIQDIVDIPLPLRKLLDVLRAAMQEMFESQPDTRSGSPLKEGDTVPLEMSSDRVEFWVADHDGGGAIIQVLSDPPSPPVRGSEAFQKLLAEEPPLPPMMEGSTIRDLRLALSNEENMRRVVAALEEAGGGVPTNRFEVDDDEEDSGSTPAKLILETTFDHSTLIDEFSATKFLLTVQERAEVEPGMILPLPSWLAESERFIREPEFLPEDLLSLSQPLEYTSTPTSPGNAIVEDGENLVTDQLEPVRASHPAQEPPPIPEQPIARQPEPEMVSEDEMLPSDYDDVEIVSGIPDIAHLAALSDGDAAEAADDAQMAQLALALTQVSLELATDAILLAQGDELVAYAGDLPEEDIEELRLQVEGDWRADSQKARMRFFTLPSSGKDYLLYTCRTEGGYALTMIFAGNMPLETIRRQSERLTEALAAIEQQTPEIIAEEEIPAAEAETFPAENATAYSIVWLLEDPDHTAFTPPLARHVGRELEQELIRWGWQIQVLEVQEDYVNLLVGIPDDANIRETIRSLMEFSADSAHDFDPENDPISLWADSYLIQRGEEPIDLLEIQDFVNFVRG